MDRRIAATDQAKIATEQGQVVSDQAIAVGAGGSINTGLSIDAGGAVTIDTGAQSLLASQQDWLAALDALTARDREALQQVTETVSSGTGEIAHQLAGALAEIKKQESTAGEDQTKRYLLWGGLGFAALWLLTQRK